MTSIDREVRSGSELQIIRRIVSILFTVWLALLANFSQLFGGSICFENKQLHSSLVVVFMVLPLVIYLLLMFVVARRERVLLTCLGLLLCFAGAITPLFGFSDLPSISIATYDWLTLKDASLLRSTDGAPGTEIKTYRLPNHGGVERREVRVFNGILWTSSQRSLL